MIEIVLNESDEPTEWLNDDGTLNVEKMQADIKKTLAENVEKTRIWQENAIESGVFDDMFNH